jgi:hypothetical protein
MGNPEKSLGQPIVLQCESSSYGVFEKEGSSEGVKEPRKKVRASTPEPRKRVRASRPKIKTGCRTCGVRQSSALQQNERNTNLQRSLAV